MSDDKKSRLSTPLIALTLGLPGMLLGSHLPACAANDQDAPEQSFYLDDRSSGSLESNINKSWRMVSDQVMGGVSKGTLKPDEISGKKCLRLQGKVSTENNGGFLQLALDYEQEGAVNPGDYKGIIIEVAGNNQSYNVHLRTRQLRFPWQSYRASYFAGSDWQTVTLPFSQFKAYKTSKLLDASTLERIGVVAIGRNFDADICIANMRLYR